MISSILQPLLLGAALLAHQTPSDTKQPSTPKQSLTKFIEEMVQKHNFDRDKLTVTLGKARFLPQIIALMEKQSSPLPWNQYRDRFINEEKLQQGLLFWRKNSEKLKTARNRYGVPEEIIVAIVGIETHYGQNKGNVKVIEALKTLAFHYPKRSELFRLQLEHFLLLSQEESISLSQVQGSYAGAIGVAQFLPSSYRHYAVDFNGDGKRDLIDSTSDAIGSIANYLTAYGWQRNQPIAVPAILEDSTHAFGTNDISKQFTLQHLQQQGVRAIGVFTSSTKAVPLMLESENDKEHWLGFNNFYVITRYNQSVYYAMSVFQLSQNLKQTHISQ